MPRARAGMSSLGAMSDAIVRVRLADKVLVSPRWTGSFGLDEGLPRRDRRFVLYQTYGSDRRDG
jgi:hypothetical protein